VRLSYTRIRAAWETGGDARFVGERFVNPGAMLSSNTAILSVIELQPITAVIHVTEKDYFRLRSEQTVILTSGAFPGKEFHGLVARVAPLLKETSREARVEIDVENADGVLKPGMFVNARIEFANKADATVVPTSALVNRGSLQGLFMADLQNKKAVFLPATVGIIEGDRAEILEPAGLAGHVITLGHHLLENGTALILPGSAPGAGVPPAKKAPGGKR
jgi:RND family efflux transporter MFP subunit